MRSYPKSYSRGWKKSVKRRYRKKKSFRKKTSLTRSRLTRYPNGIADQAWVKLTYASNQLFPNVAVAPYVSTIRFAGNRIHDCGLTGDNHNANSLQIWRQMYSHYTCYASKIEVKYIYNVTGAQPNYYVVTRAIPTLGNAAYTGDIVTQAMTDPYNRNSIIGGSNSTLAIRRHSMYNKQSKVVGTSNQVGQLKNNIRSTNDLTDVATTPDWYWESSLGPLNTALTSVDGTQVRVVAKVTYYVKFFSRQDLDMETSAA